MVKKIAFLFSFLVFAPLVQAQQSQKVNPGLYWGRIGPNSPKIKTVGKKLYLWASGDQDPASTSAQWFDFTGSPIPASELQFGIGKDRIRAIDHPRFVSPDDPRLKKWSQDPLHTDILVIGYVHGGEARAYPIGLLNHHELVNDRIGGKPITVGW